MEEKNINFITNSIKGLLLKKIRTNCGITQKEIALQIDKSEISIKKYENGMLNIPFSVLFLAIHILNVSKIETENFLNEIFEENSDNFSTKFKEKCLKKIKSDIERIFENVGEETDENTEYSDLDKIKLEKQIKKYIRKIGKTDKKVNISNENSIIKEVISFLNFKINETEKN